jgi:hypothetical protein
VVGYDLSPTVRRDLLAKLGRFDEGRTEFERAVPITQSTQARVAPRARPSVGRRLSAARAAVTKAVRLALCTHSRRAAQERSVCCWKFMAFSQSKVAIKDALGPRIQRNYFCPEVR